MADDARAPAALRVTVSASLAPREVCEWPLVLPAGATLAEALQAAGLDRAQLSGLSVGIWGRESPLQAPLSDGDRVECCRPLMVDPKVARRQRFARQGARTAGLFSARRPGAKPGY